MLDESWELETYSRLFLYYNLNANKLKTRVFIFLLCKDQLPLPLCYLVETSAFRRLSRHHQCPECIVVLCVVLL